MAKAGERLIEGAKEALAIAKGEVPASRLHVAGHAYYPVADVYAAIEVVKAHLDKEWIADGCAEDHAFGCASCQAVALRKQLDGLASWIEDEEPLPSPLEDTP